MPATRAFLRRHRPLHKRFKAAKASKHGGAAPPDSLYKLAAEQAYEKVQTPLPGGYEPVPGGTATVRAWKQASSPDLLIGVRGTDDARDMSANASLLYNGLRGTNRYKADEATVRKLIAAHPGAKVHLASHSLGSAVARELENVIPIATSRAFNAAFQPSTFQKPGIQQRHYKGSDFLGQIGRYLPGAKHMPSNIPETKKSKWYDPRSWKAFQHHSLTGFGKRRGGMRSAKFCEKYGLPVDMNLQPCSTSIIQTRPFLRRKDFPNTVEGRNAYVAAMLENQRAHLDNAEIEKRMYDAGPGKGGSRFVGGSSDNEDDDYKVARREQRAYATANIPAMEALFHIAEMPLGSPQQFDLIRDFQAFNFPNYNMDWPRTIALWTEYPVFPSDEEVEFYQFHPGYAQSGITTTSRSQLQTLLEDEADYSTAKSDESGNETRSRSLSTVSSAPAAAPMDDGEIGGGRKKRSRFVGGSESNPVLSDGSESDAVYVLSDDDDDADDDDADYNEADLERDRRNRRRFGRQASANILPYIQALFHIADMPAGTRMQELAIQSLEDTYPRTGRLIDWPRTVAGWRDGRIVPFADGYLQVYEPGVNEPYQSFPRSYPQYLIDRMNDVSTAVPSGYESPIRTRSRNASIVSSPPETAAPMDDEDSHFGGSRKKRVRETSRVLLTERRNVARFGDKAPVPFVPSTPRVTFDPYRNYSVVQKHW